MLKIQVIGNIGADATVSNVSGRQVINFNVCHQETWKDNAGTKHERAVWVGCSYWTDKTAIGQYLKKGVQVYVEGTGDIKFYDSKNGPQSQITCKVQFVQLLGGKKEETTNPPRTNYSTAGVQESDISGKMDDLPF
jgi:single-strand DNA-binding protein